MKFAHVSETNRITTRHGAMKTTIKRFFAAVALTSISGVANADLINLAFSGTYQNSGGDTVFGESGSDIPFFYTMTYDTALDTNAEFFDTGDMIDANTTIHQWYGYSASGIVASNFTIGTKTFSTGDIVAISPGAGAFADIWFDTDIALATPTRTAIIFSDIEGALWVGGGFYVDLDNTIFLGGGVSQVQDNETTSVVVGPMNIGGTEVPSPATLALVGLGLAGLGWTRRKSAWHLHYLKPSSPGIALAFNGLPCLILA